MRYVLLSLLILVLSGCSTSGELPFMANYKARQAFYNGLEQWDQTHSSEKLAMVSRDYPDSDWGERANQLTMILSALESKEKRIDELTKENKRITKDLERSSAENKKLQDENKRMQHEIAELNKNIDKLKKLMVDYELRTK